MSVDASTGVTVDGVSVTTATDFKTLVRSQLAGSGPGRNATDVYPVDWILRVEERLRGTPLHDRLSEAVADCLTSPDALVRTQALHYFQSAPLGRGGERIVTLLRGPERALFAGVADPTHPDYTLEWQLLTALAARLSSEDPPLIELAREEALKPGLAVPLIGALTAQDTEWVLGHADKIVTGTPGALVGILFGLQQLGREFVALGERLAPFARRDANFRSYLQSFIDDAEARRKILAAADRSGMLVD
jgi:hypothetical protein